MPKPCTTDATPFLLPVGVCKVVLARYNSGSLCGFLCLSYHGCCCWFTALFFCPALCLFGVSCLFVLLLCVVLPCTVYSFAFLVRSLFMLLFWLGFSCGRSRGSSAGAIVSCPVQEYLPVDTTRSSSIFVGACQSQLRVLIMQSGVLFTTEYGVCCALWVQRQTACDWPLPCMTISL